MCVRYTLSEPKQAIDSVAERVSTKLSSEGWEKPRYNVGLTQKAPVVVRRENRMVLEVMKWGFVNQASGGSVLANARIETITKLPTFKDAVISRRCVIPANGFFEFQDLGKRKQPYLFTLKEAKPMALAGIWKYGESLNTFQFCILTTRPNSLVSPIHDRMPVILSTEALSAWLNGNELDQTTLDRIAMSCAAENMATLKVSSYVNNVRNEGPECIKEEVALPELF